ncbi:class I SAM-dependent methyltransferase [Candidatus Odyssella thessalonicensis]|uniref:class I SAM-dependent methyltransferase n=1 Tax=Candidatus Odyssella thessalonicensis TaxID=84647 RepID=UPI000225AED2|nr:class I SAM-dependent methyltransferase [Candidatus Odyssella thessalonicensis]
MKKILLLLCLYSSCGAQAMERPDSQNQNAPNTIPLLASETTPTCDLTDITILKPLIHPAFRNDQKLIHLAIRLLKNTQIRAVGSDKYGQTFPINSEILKELMLQARGKVVCELAAGPGSNCIFLALAGAKKVYVNDITQEEIDKLRELISPLSSKFKRKFEMMAGDMFKLPQRLAGECDIIYCRNFIHLLPDTQLASFFSQLKWLLKPQGKIVLTAQAAKNLITDQWQAKSKSIRGYFINSQGPLFESLPYYCVEQPTEEDGNPLDYQKFYPLSIEDGRLSMNIEQIKAMPEKLRNFFKEHLSEIREVKTTEDVKFAVLANHINYFSPESLSHYANLYGFRSNQCFISDIGTGHIVKTDGITLDSSLQVTLFATLVGS